MPHVRATAIVFSGKQNDRKQLFLDVKKQRIFCSAFGELIKYSRIFLVEPLQVVVFHVSFSLFFYYKWLNVIGNHLHTSEQAICD